METELMKPFIANSKNCTIEEFLQFIETSEFRFEYLNGKILPVSATTQAHALITGNIAGLLKNHLKPKGCKCFHFGVFLRIKDKNSLFLPDVLVTCSSEDFAPKSYFVDSPTIIVEVLCDNTELLDRSVKLNQYTQIPSLQYYIMVSQKKPLVEVFFRKNAQSLFYLQDSEGLDAIVDLREMDIKIPMQDIYDGIVFETTTELP